MGFLKNPKFDLQPILDVISHTILPLEDQIEWGYRIPYMLTGILNQHPLAAMKWMDTDRKNEFTDFYNEITEHLE